MPSYKKKKLFYIGLIVIFAIFPNISTYKKYVDDTKFLFYMLYINI